MINFLAEYDLAGAEWVIVAYLTQDERMLEVAESGQSPHPATIHFMTGLPIETILLEDKFVGKTTDPKEVETGRRKLVMKHGTDFTKTTFLPTNMSLYQAGKKANHSLDYGEGPNRFADQNQISVREAKLMRQLYFNAYPGILEWWQKVEFQVRKTRFLETCFERRIRFQGPIYGSGSDKTMREAYSAVPQSTCVEITNYGMVRVDSEMPSVRLKSQNHDSITVQHAFDPKKISTETARILSEMLDIKQAMSTPCNYNGREFVLGVDCKAGLNWADYDAKTNPDGMVELAYEPVVVEEFLRRIS